MSEDIFNNCILPEDFQTLTDTEKTIRFLRALGYQDSDKVFLRRVDDKKRPDHPAANMDCQLYQFPTFLGSVKKMNEEEGYGLFLVVNGDGHKDKDVKTVRAHFMEIDDIPLEDQAARIFAFPLQPSIIVRTRKSLHAYWLIQKGQIRKFRDIQKRLANYFGGDVSVSNESRTMRLPYSYHNKQERIKVEIIHFNPDNIYSQDELDALLPEISGDDATQKATGKNECYELPDIIAEHYRNNALFMYACSLQSKGYTDSEIRQMVHDANRDRCAPPLSEAETDQIIMSCLSRYKKGNALKRFHKFANNGQPFDIIDDEIARYIIAHEHLMVMDGKLYLYNHGVYSLDEDGICIRDKIKKLLFTNVIKNNRIKQVLDLIMADISIQKDLAHINAYPEDGCWINFKNGMLDVLTMQMHEHDPDYFSINQIPHDYDLTYSVPQDSIVVRFAQIKFPDEADRKMFFQYCGYCMTKETSWQKFLVLFGPGNTGKSTLIRLLSSAIGDRNISNLPLQDINERFAATNFCGKLLNACAELPPGKVEQVDVIKRCTGEDMLKGEYKGGKVFFFKSYAKLIFSANKIPAIPADEAEPFFRRFMLIEIDDRGSEIPNLETLLQKDIKTFLYLSVNALHDALINGFFESPNSLQHIHDLKAENDPVLGFLMDHTARDRNARTQTTKVYKAYEQYCYDIGQFSESRQQFYAALLRKGFRKVTLTGDEYIKGLRLIEEDFHSCSTESDVPFD